MMNEIILFIFICQKVFQNKNKKKLKRNEWLILTSREYYENDLIGK